MLLASMFNINPLFIYGSNALLRKRKILKIDKELFYFCIRNKGHDV
jgi:hypothetical protein